MVFREDPLMPIFNVHADVTIGIYGKVEADDEAAALVKAEAVRRRGDRLNDDA